MADAPIGVVYNTSMTRPDAALALAALYPMEGRRECHMGSVCVTGAGLDAAIFCDIIAKLYTFGPRNGNQALAVGLAAEPGVADSAMARAAVERRNEKGEPLYARSIRRVTDTSLAEAVLRNGVIFNAESVVILSGPATYLAKSLDLAGTKELYKQRVKRLVIVDAGTPYGDGTALRKIVAEWPSPIVFSPSAVGEELLFPGGNLDRAFSWAPAHPVVDAYKAYRAMPYDAPLYDLAAIHYAVHPDSGYFRVAEAGSPVIGDDGAVRFAGGAGSVKTLSVEPARKAALLAALFEAATAKPVQPAPVSRGGRGAAGSSGRAGAASSSGRGAASSDGRGAASSDGRGAASSDGRGAAIGPAIVPPTVTK